MSDWFDKALEEFLFDVGVKARTTKETAAVVYHVLDQFGVIDYDIMKEFLRDQYTEEEIEDDE